MSEEVKVEVEINEGKPKSQSTGESVGKVLNEAGESVGKAINTFMETLESALTGRGNTVMVRVNDEALEKLDMLVAAGICKSRSESAAFLLQRGIESSAELFDRIASVTTKITKMREELLESVKKIK